MRTKKDREAWFWYDLFKIPSVLFPYFIICFLILMVIMYLIYPQFIIALFEPLESVAKRK